MRSEDKRVGMKAGDRKERGESTEGKKHRLEEDEEREERVYGWRDEKRGQASMEEGDRRKRRKDGEGKEKHEGK